MIKAEDLSFPGLYGITPSGWSAERLLAAVEQAMAGGAALIQYRDKPRPEPELAARLVALGRQHGVGVIINDDVELALACGAAGVHLGKDDGDLAQARQRLGAGAVIGVSCYDRIERAREAAAAGASYLAFGSLFDSPTKPAAVRCPPAVLGQARELGLPVVAIGGITAENVTEAVAAGADLVAVISDLFTAPDIRRRAMEYQKAFRPGAEP